MQLDSNSLLFGALIIVVSFIINLIVVLIVKRSIRNDRMSKMITMQQAAFRTESAATLDRMRTSSKECQQNVDVSVSHAEDMVRQISDSLRTLSEYQEDLTALQSVCAEYKTALEKLRISTDQAEARISAVQAEVRKVEAVNDKMDSFRAEAERSMNQLQDLKAEYVRLVASTQESLRSASETQKSDNEAMLAAFSQQIERARELFGSFGAQERMDFKDFADGEMKKAEDQAIDTENRRDSILRSLEEGKAELDAFREDLSGAVSSLRDLRDGIRKECEESASAFRSDTAQSREEAEKALAQALELSRTHTAIVEEFKSGDELSADLYIEGRTAKLLSVTVSEKRRNVSSFTITQSRYPAVGTEERDSITAIGQRIADAFGLTDTPLLVQMIRNAEGLWVIEFSARMGGGTKYRIIELLSGVNIMRKYVELVLGGRPAVDPHPFEGSLRMNYVYCNPGTMAGLGGFEELKADGTIADYVAYKNAGATFEHSETSSDRAAGYLVTGATEEEVLAKQERANALLRVTDPEGNDIMRHDFKLF